MQVIKELQEIASQSDTLLTIGVFDGVHLGHQHLIGRLVEQASLRGLSSGVVTFQQRPMEMLAPESKVTYLTTLEERISLLRGLGVELIAALSFTRELSRLSASRFLGLMKKHLRMRGLIIGPDFALGRGREGDVPSLRLLGEKLGFTVEVVPHLVMEGQIVSSTAIREALGRGDMVMVRKLLGRSFSLRGTVVRGDGRGRLLGFPTANLAVNSNQALPADGVYVTQAYVGSEQYQAVTNIGIRPTFGESRRVVEVYLLDFQSDLYDRELKIDLWERLRPELEFKSPEELKAQMERDVEQARDLLEQG